MESWYWIAEYGKVFCGYLFFMFLWPSVVFGNHLKGKGAGYRFAFSVTVQVVIANTAVLMLGLFHVLYPQALAVLLYGIFFLALLRNISHRFGAFQAKAVWKKFRVHAGEYSVLAILLIFGMVYFSYGAFQVHSYGFGDLYTHHGWIYGLQEGKIFSGGVYPEAMHCFIYCLNALFGIPVYSSLMFLQGIHVAVFLTAAYLLLREVFHWRYTPLLALALFLTLEVASADQIYGMFRLQITLPLEFGLYTQFLCALYLLWYLKSTHRLERKGQKSRCYWDENLFLFLMSLAASVSIHFYTTIMAFILCGSFAVFSLKRLFVKERFIPLMTAVLCGCMIAAVPMAGALISGIPFNTSINWAVNAMDGEETRGLEDGSGDSGAEHAQSVKKETNQPSFFEKVKGIYWKGYAALYGERGAEVILLITGAAIILCLLSWKKLLNWSGNVRSGYPPLILAAFLFVFLYAAPRVGLPEIISDSRACSTGHLLITALLALPADVVFSLCVRFCRDMILQILSILSVAGIYVTTILTGHFHGYLFFELSRYNAAVEVTNAIIEEFPEKSYVVVSPTDELYPLIEHGWHEELLTFVKSADDAEYMLSSEHVFVFVEKRPLQYAQAYFFEGPEWLAQTKYKDIYWKKYSKKYPDTGAVQAPDTNASEISEEEAGKELIEYSNPWFSYIKLPARTILEAKAYELCQGFLEAHPESAKVYYEDDDFICYHFRQNGDS